MKRILILILILCSFASFGQIILDPTASTTSATRMNQIISGSFPTTGVDAYSVNFTGSYSYTALTGQAISITIPSADVNTGAATLNFDGLGTRDILKWSSGSLVAVDAGDLIGTIRVRYDGTQFVMEGGAGSGSVDFVDILGSPYDNTNLATELDLKLNKSIYYAHSWKQYATVATTVNGTLSTAFEQGDVIDGVTLSNTMRILLKNQSTASQNGLYSVNVSGAPTRVDDYNTGEIGDGAVVYISQGTANQGRAFKMTSPNVTIGTTSQVWAAMGDVAGPSSSTDNLVATWDGTTGKLLKNTTTPNISAADAVTQSPGNNTTKVATTAFVTAAVTAVGTPTFQQVLTAGSVLTNNVLIDGTGTNPNFSTQNLGHIEFANLGHFYILSGSDFNVNSVVTRLGSSSGAYVTTGPGSTEMVYGSRAINVGSDLTLTRGSGQIKLPGTLTVLDTAAYVLAIRNSDKAIVRRAVSSISGGGGSVNFAKNGVYLDADTVKWGTSLTENTVVGGGLFDLKLGDSGDELGEFYVKSQESITHYSQIDNNIIAQETSNIDATNIRFDSGEDILVDAGDSLKLKTLSKLTIDIAGDPGTVGELLQKDASGGVIWGNLANATGLPPTTGIVGWPSNAAGVLTNNGSGTLTWGAGGGGGGLTVGTSTITSGTNTRILYDNSGVLGEYTLTGSGTAVAMGTTPTFTTNITTPLVIGGTGTTSPLTYKTTSGVGTTGADHIFQVGNNGATEALRILNNAKVGVRTASPSAVFEVGATAGDGGGIGLNLLANGSATSSYSSIDFTVPTTGLIGQFFGTASNYSSGADLQANSLGLVSWAGQLFLSAGGSTSNLDMYSGGYTSVERRISLQSGGTIIMGPGSMVSSNNRLEINGKGTTTGYNFLSRNSSGTDRFAIEDNGEVVVSGSGGSATQVLTSAGADAPPTWTNKTQDVITGGSVAKETQSSGSTTHRTYETLWIDAAGTSVTQDINIMNGYTDATASIIFTVVGVKSDGSESTGAQYAATFNKDGGTTVVEVGAETQIYHHETDAATTVTISVASNLIRVVVDSGDADSYRWTVFAKVTITQL